MAKNIQYFYNIGEYRSAAHLDGSNADDWFIIGGDQPKTFHHGIWPADIVKRHNRGNIGALAGQGEVEIDTGAGNDRIDTGLNAYDGKVDWSATVNPGNIWGNATVKMGHGDDVLNVGKPHTDFNDMTWNLLGANIHGARIYMGMGHDTISVRQDVDGRAIIYTDDPGPDQMLPRSASGDKNASTREVVSPKTGGNDTLMIGGTVGDIVNLANGSPRIHMGGGDDKLRVAGPVWAHSLIDMGEGNNHARVRSVRMWGKMLFGSGDDVLDVDKSIVEGARIEMDDPAKTPGGVIEYAENVVVIPSYQVAGDDTLNVGGNITGNASVDMGGGDDTLNVAGSIRFKAKVELGEGHDKAHIKDGITGWAQVDFGGGNDTARVDKNIVGFAKVDMGDGNDTLNVGIDVENFAKVYMGNGDDTFTANRLLNNAEVHMGDGNNTATVKAIDHYAKMFFGSGNDQLTITDSFGFFAVQDRLLLKNSGAQVDMGAGDDVVTYGGKTLTGVIRGGEGKDTFVLTYDADDSLVSGLSAMKNVTNLSTLNIKGFEVIRMEGKNVVDVKYTDLLHDDSRDGPLYIQGNSSSKVDLGSTNWSSDGADKARLKENLPIDVFDLAKQGEWSKNGSAEVDGVQYDIYHHSKAGADTSNDVYIQQGVVVI